MTCNHAHHKDKKKKKADAWIWFAFAVDLINGYIGDAYWLGSMYDMWANDLRDDDFIGLSSPALIFGLVAGIPSALGGAVMAYHLNIAHMESAHGKDHHEECGHDDEEHGRRSVGKYLEICTDDGENHVDDSSSHDGGSEGGSVPEDDRYSIEVPSYDGLPATKQLSLWSKFMLAGNFVALCGEHAAPFIFIANLLWSSELTQETLIFTVIVATILGAIGGWADARANYNNMCEMHGVELPEGSDDIEADWLTNAGSFVDTLKGIINDGYWLVGFFNQLVLMCVSMNAFAFGFTWPALFIGLGLAAVSTLGSMISHRLLNVAHQEGKLKTQSYSVKALQEASKLQLPDISATDVGDTGLALSIFDDPSHSYMQWDRSDFVEAPHDPVLRTWQRLALFGDYLSHMGEDAGPLVQVVDLATGRSLSPAMGLMSSAAGAVFGILGSWVDFRTCRNNMIDMKVQGKLDMKIDVAEVIRTSCSWVCPFFDRRNSEKGPDASTAVVLFSYP